MYLINEAFDKLINEGTAEKVPDNEIFKPGQQKEALFLPCFPVFQLDRATTKVRLVLDGASKTQTGNSYNDALINGPLLLTELLKLFIQFRGHKIAVATDLKSQFLQFHLHRKRDIDHQRYLWRYNDKNKVPSQYRIRTLCFGNKHSPFSALYLCFKHAQLNEQQFKLAAYSVKNHQYVDDILTGCNNLKDALKLVKELTDLFASASIQLHKFSSNDPRVLKNLAPHQKADLNKIKILGVNWDPTKDSFHFKFTDIDINENKTEKFTKRKLLSEISKIFDPAGILNAIILRIKILMQDVHLLKCGWDDILPEPIQTLWLSLRKELVRLNDFELPRYLSHGQTTDGNPAQVILVTFCDASIHGYSAVSYILTKFTNNEQTCNFVVAKSRVCPIKMRESQDKSKICSVPRLELMSLVLAVRLAAYVKNSLADQLKFDHSFYFSDSSITIMRLRNGFKPYKQWTSNRLKEILSQISADQVLHVPTELNVADISSRPVEVADFLNKKANNTWLHGPQFLIDLPFEKWSSISHINDKKYRPENPVVDDEIATLRRPFVFVAKQCNDLFFLQLVERFSSWPKLVYFFAAILRFGYKGHKNYRGQKMTAEEKSNVENFLIRTCQRIAFPDEFKMLETGENINKKSVLANFNPFLNNNKLIASNTRLSLLSHLNESQKFPIIIPRHDKLVEMLLLHLHQTNYHVGITQMLSIVRDNYVILGGRREVKRIINKCGNIRCKKLVQITQLMSPLPVERITPGHCFVNVSMDYFGPLVAKTYEGTKLKLKKVWVAIFTCLASRAIHLELVTSLETVEVINALRLVIARRGKFSTLYSDNFSSFKHAKKEMANFFKAIKWEQIEDHLTNHGIKWTFSPPYAPHYNGAAERLIGVVKVSLLKTLGNKSLSLRNLAIILAECEALTNDRPLTTTDEIEYHPLSPSELLFGRKLRNLPTQTTVENLEFKSLWRLRKNLLSNFWKTFSRDYLFTLSLRKKWQFPTNVDLTGLLVLVNDKNLKKNHWKLARIINCVKSKDDKVRAVQLQLPSGGKIFRSISSLSFFEEDFLKQSQQLDKSACNDV